MTGALTAAERAFDRWVHENAEWLNTRPATAGYASCEAAGEWSVVLYAGALRLECDFSIEASYDEWPAEERKEMRARIRRGLRHRLDFFRRLADAVGPVAGWDGAYSHGE